MHIDFDHMLLSLLLMILFSTIVFSEHCSLELKDAGKGTHLIVENCHDIGTISVGALYKGRWRKLTYHYPRTWEGTFISVIVDGRVYANSENPNDVSRERENHMDLYIEEMPAIQGDNITTRWRLPGRILVEEKLQLMENGTRIQIKLTNEDTEAVNTGVRIQVDTMLGDNDGAPVYVPGDGLRSTETEYSGNYLNFDYWKAYNRRDEASIVSTGILYGQGLSYPCKLVIANWKRSMYSSWSYEVNESTSIIGDSAVLLYYGPVELEPSQSITFSTIYGGGEPISTASKDLRIAEIVTDKVTKVYTAGENVSTVVDVVNRGENVSEGDMVEFRVLDLEGRVVHKDIKYLGAIERDAVKNIKFNWATPKITGYRQYKAVAVLYRDSTKIDQKIKNILVNSTTITKVESQEEGFNWMILIIPLLFLILALLIVFCYVYLKREDYKRKVVDMLREAERKDIYRRITGKNLRHEDSQDRYRFRLYSGKDKKLMAFKPRYHRDRRTKGVVNIKKFRKGDTVRLEVSNNTNQAMNNSVVVDELADSTRVNILDSGTVHKSRILITEGNRLVWDIGHLKPGERVALEYRIQGLTSLPKAKLRWDHGEMSSK